MTTTVLERRVGAQALVVVVGDQVINGPQIGNVKISRGRDAPGQRFGPGTCTITYHPSPVEVIPALGSPLVVTLSESALDWATAGYDNNTRDKARRRFTGDVTDVDVRLAPETGNRIVTVTGAGRLARLGRIVPFPLPTEFVYPQSLDGVRAADLLGTITSTAAGAPLAGGTHNPGTFEVAGQPVVDIVGRTAASLFDALSQQTLGELVDDKFGAVSWHDANHRNSGSAPVTLAAADLILGTSVSLDLTGLTNIVTVDYFGTGPPVTVTDTASQNTYGPHRSTVDAPLQLTDTAATRLGEALLARHATPSWQYDALQLDIIRTLGRYPLASGSWADQTGPWADQTAVWSAVRTAPVLALDLDQPLQATGIPGGPHGSTVELWLEGYTETLTPDAWRLSLRVTTAT